MERRRHQWGRWRTTILSMLLLVVALSTLCIAAADEENKESFVTTSMFLRHLFFGGPKLKEEEKPYRGMLVIGAGFGRTGTASFTEAMKRLGLKPYHMKDGVVMTPGQLELWSDHSRMVLQEGKSDDEGLLDEIIDSMTQHGFTSTNDFPSCLLYKRLMRRFPSAKVVLTVRSDGGDGWATSTLSSIMFLDKALHQPPWNWFEKLRRFVQVGLWVKHVTNTPVDPETQMPRREDLRRAYDDWVKSVQQEVPPEKLLVLHAKDGWKPLCDFVSDLDEEIAAHCAEILRTSEPYPYVNEKSEIQRLIFFLQSVTLVVTLVIPGVALVAVMAYVLRRLTPKKPKAAAKKNE